MTYYIDTTIPKSEYTDRAMSSLASGDRFPYDSKEDEYGENALKAKGWAHRAARGVLNDLCDRRRIKHVLEDLDDDVKEEITGVMTEIISQAFVQHMGLSSRKRLSKAIERGLEARP